MHFYSGYYFCTKSHWNNDFFDVSNMVVIESHSEDFSNNDFKNLIAKKEIFDEEEYSFWADQKEYKNDKVKLERLKSRCWKKCNYLKEEVVKWLQDNIRDSQSGEKGWCMGNDSYNSNGSLDFCLWFYRRKDALKFIRTWSEYQKPTETYNQNTYVKKKLDLKTRKLVIENDDD